MLNKTTARNRINQLMALDKETDNQTNEFSNQYLEFIENHLSQFYYRYADKNGLSLSQTSQRINQWDVNQWKNAIEQLNIDSTWPKNATSRIAALAALAHVDKNHMIYAILALGLVANTAKNYMEIKRRVSADGVDQLNRLKNNLSIDNDVVKKDRQIIKDAEKTPWAKNIWSDNDKIANSIEQLVRKNIKRGLTTRKLGEMMSNDINRNSNPNKYLADNVSQTQSSSARIVRTESSRLIDQINMSTFKMTGVHLVDWVTMPHACPICVSIQDDNPYSIWSVPNIPQHPNCRCIKTIHDDSGSNLINPNLLF